MQWGGCLRGVGCNFAAKVQPLLGVPSALVCRVQCFLPDSGVASVVGVCNDAKLGFEWEGEKRLYGAEHVVGHGAGDAVVADV